MVFQRVSSWYESGTKIFAGATKLRLINRLTVLFGLSSQILLGAVESAATLNPGTWIAVTGRVLVNVNSEMISIVSQLQGGVAQFKALQLTLALYSLFYLQYWVMKKMSNFLRWLAFGDDVAELPLNMVVIVFIIAPVQIVGGFLVQGGFVTPFSGVVSVVQNLGIWLDPLMQFASNFSSGGKVNSTVNSTGNLSNTSNQVFT